MVYAEGDEEFTNAQAQMYVAIAASPDDRILNLLSAATWAREPPWAEAKGFVVSEVPHISGIELYVTPWDWLDWHGPEGSERSALWAGKIIGVQLSLADFDEQAGVYESYATLFGQEQVWNDAGHFADGPLLRCDYGDCGGAVAPEPSAVTAVSWARIKAGFR